MAVATASCAGPRDCTQYEWHPSCNTSTGALPRTIGPARIGRKWTDPHDQSLYMKVASGDTSDPKLLRILIPPTQTKLLHRHPQDSAS